MRREMSLHKPPMFRPNLIIIVVGLCFVFDSRLFVRAVCCPMIVRMLGEKEREGEREWGKW